MNTEKKTDVQVDKFRLDSHKLIYHPKRVADWLSNKPIYPIYVEVGPSGLCNCRCIFCSVDYIGYQNRFLETGMLKERLTEMARLGVKSIMFAGEGEPFIHKDMAEIIVHTKKAGLDVAITTNGILMKPDISEKILGCTEWIKVSCNAGSPGTYAKVHRCKPDDFNQVISNLEQAVMIRRKEGFNCALGIQILLLPENASEVMTLAKTARDIGLDYLVVKPYTRHSKNVHAVEVQYDEYRHLGKELKTLNNESFSAIFRTLAMEIWDTKQRCYGKCMALPFWAHIDAGGNVWGCGAHLENDRFLYGNINKTSFQDVWEGDKRQKALHWTENEFDINSCRLNCRMDKINQYLWDLKNPIEHVNFI